MRVVKKILKKKGKRAPGTRSLPPATTLPKRPPLGGKRRECSLVAFPWSPMDRYCSRCAPSHTAGAPRNRTVSTPHAELRAPLTPVQGNPTGTSVTPKPFLLCPSVSCRVKGWHNRRSSSRWRETCRGHRDDDVGCSWVMKTGDDRVMIR